MENLRHSQFINTGVDFNLFVCEIFIEGFKLLQ